eukprot:gnl/MRDRNA2_/MRDRNA2_63591_c0_seq2.p1 gnl/MRDRNA2_/MRDRNA2_63591_c0~~gnl/MRDRNA2_/MRDRNA2_63591_c0_seq2.p1  ORF type:complete len:185 (+),score=54.15 gnl/MRDRNA2_/MRDRNA2_63591_c0_seq2:155-709(+)
MVPTAGDGKVLGIIQPATVARGASWTSVFALMGAGAFAVVSGCIGLTLRRLSQPPEEQSKAKEQNKDEKSDIMPDRSSMEEKLSSSSGTHAPVSLETRFEHAQAATKAMPSLSNQDKLKLYAFYKQAQEGPVSGQRPGALDPVGRAKYDAWKGLDGMDTDIAKEEYCTLVLKIKEASQKTSSST